MSEQQGAVADPQATGGTTDPAPRRKRGRESAGDMIRSLGVVMIVVVALWFFARPPASDSAKVRTVDPTQDISAFVDQHPGAPVPRELPAGWRSTSSTLSGDPETLRIGYVTPRNHYAEYDGIAAAADTQTFASLTGSERSDGEAEIAGASWQRYRDDKGALSLVRAYGGVTVVVSAHRGSKDSAADQEELATLIGALRG